MTRRHPATDYMTFKDNGSLMRDNNKDVIVAIVSIIVVLVVSFVLFIAAKTFLRPYSSGTHSFVKTDKTKSRQDRKLYRPPTGYFLNKENLYIYTQTWTPTKAGTGVKAVVLLVHGVGEHCGRYAALARRMCDELDVAIVTMDHQGHGKSEGDRLFVVDFNNYLEDIVSLANIAKQSFPGVPLMLLGHSLGGLMAIRTMEKYPDLFTGAVISAPALSVVASATELKLAPLLSERLPHFPTSKIDPNLLSHDPCVVDLYCNDPLVCTQGVTARLACEILGAIDKALAYAGEIKMPYLLIRGGDDQVTLKPGIEAFHKATASPDKQFVELKGLFHEIFNEVDSPAPSIVIDWLRNHIANATL